MQERTMNEALKGREKMIDTLPLKQTFKAFYALLKIYWTDKESLCSWIYLVIILGLTGGSVYIATAINSWYKSFWDTIQNYDVDAFTHQILIFCLLASIHVVVTVYNAFLKAKMSIAWRKFLTKKMMHSWLDKDAYYKIQLTDSKTDNPDQRIADDLNLFVSSTIALVLGLGTDLAMVVTFSIVLWELSQAVDLTLWNGYVLHLPDGYLFYLALVYSILGTVVTFLLGKPLVKLNFRQQRFEADFRFSLIRVREAAESISLYKGQREEELTLQDRFKSVVKNYVLLINCTKRLGFLTLGYAQLAVIFPILIAAPIYFAKLITMGTIMQITSAFGRVQDSLSTLVSNFTALASWKSVVDRLSLFVTSMEQAKDLKCITPENTDELTLCVNSLEVKTQNDKLLASNINLSLTSGDKLLIQGPSGCGKSTLIRSIAGIWPYSHGVITMPAFKYLLFLSQKPYLPQGTLRQCAYYPQATQNDGRLEDLMDKLNLSHLKGSIDEDRQWTHILSLGEMQRIAFIRALLNKPKIVFLDEASSALDEKLESIAYRLLFTELHDSIIVSVGHRSTLIDMHNKKLICKDTQNWIFE